jgi:hypothetical protein
MANAERWAGGLAGPAYAINDEKALKVVDGTVEVVSEGTGNRSRPRTETWASVAPMSRAARF